MSTDQKIDLFCKYFNDQVKVIQALRIDSNAAEGTDQENYQIIFYKKALLVTQLDTLAGIRCPDGRYPQLNKRNRERFIKFLSSSGIWPEGDLISIPFIAEHTKTGKISKGILRDFVTNKLSTHFAEKTFNIASKKIDEPIENLLKIATTEQEEKVINENHHFELLYRYRNYLVHESRIPGNAMEVVPENEPYYHGYIGEDKLFLAYPINLFVNILVRAIEFVEKYLKSNKFNPYDFVQETSRW